MKKPLIVLGAIAAGAIIYFIVNMYFFAAGVAEDAKNYPLINSGDTIEINDSTTMHFD